MTCISCGFENPDNEETCFRCGQSLDTDAIDVIPERLKRGRPSSRWRQRLSARLERDSFRMFRRPGYYYALLSLFPGLGQFVAGRRRRGLWALGLWSACLVLRLVSSPPPFWNSEIIYAWLLTPDYLTISVHTSIIVDAYRIAPNRLRGHMEALHVCIVALLSWSLLAAFHSATGVTAPNQVFRVAYPGYSDPNIAPGDVLAVWRVPGWRALPVGTVVVLHLERLQDIHIYGPVPATLMAVGGDTVSFRDNSIQVNGVATKTPSFIQSGLSQRTLQECQLKPGQYLVFPPILTAVDSLQDLVVEREQIWGVVTRVIEPRARRRTLKW